MKLSDIWSADLGYPKGLELKNIRWPDWKESLKFGFIHEQPDVDLEVELEELGIISNLSNQINSIRIKGFSIHITMRSERQYQLYLDRM